MKIFALILLIIAAGYTLWGMVRTKRPVGALLLTALSGIAALFAVNLLGTVLPVNLPVNWASIGTGALVGVPGIVGLLVLQIVMG